MRTVQLGTMVACGDAMRLRCPRHSKGYFLKFYQRGYRIIATEAKSQYKGYNHALFDLKHNQSLSLSEASRLLQGH